MKDADINKKFEVQDKKIDDKFIQQDKDFIVYTDNKFRARFKPLAPFVWMGKKPGRVIIAFVGIFYLLNSIFDYISLKDIIAFIKLIF